ncbi:MAG TPA: T9SS type A sorting domain-containing protein [Bacteroidia bacterium]|jgi:hypothetical protein|nr:T9SS type A sorting domain-containing protein [Bacteroidia bacterium]
MKKQLLTLALGVSSLAAFSQTPSTIWKSYNSNLAASHRVEHISVVDTNIVWGVDGTQYNMFTRTTDGANFHGGLFNPDTVSFNIAGISAVDANTAFIATFNKSQTATNSGQILKTTDGGTTWVNKVTAGMYTGSTVAFIDWVHFWDANNGIVFGDPNGHTVSTATVNMWEIYRTGDGGATWNRVADANVPTPINGDGGLTSSYTTFKHFMWAGTFNGLVLASADSGRTWTYPNSTTIGLDGGCNGVAFRDSIHGLAWGVKTAGGSDFGLVSTSDGGVTWTPRNLTTSAGDLAAVNDICAVPKSNMFMSVGLDSALTSALTSVTYDDGATWTVKETGTSNPVRMLCVHMIDSTNGWAGNYSDTSSIYQRGKGGMNKFGLHHANGCPIAITTTSSSTPYNVCLGSAITMTASGLNTYTWSTTATTASISATPTASATYSVAGTTTAGCANYETVNITAISGTVVATAPGHTVCPGTPTALIVSGSTTYSWSPATALSVTTGSTSTSTATTSVTYTVSGVKNNCPLTPATINMVIKTVPTVSVTASSYSICPGATATLTASGTATTYTWSGNAGSATTASVAVTPTVSTTYTVTGNYTVTNCPTKTAVTVSVGCVGIENYTSTSNVHVYPNPSTGLVTISLTNVETGTVMYVTNMIGQQVAKTTLKDLNTNFDFSSFEKGVYFVTVTNGNNKHVEKLIIQ